jgi:hypothetical protein
MDDSSARLFFLCPACPSQRQYEALRAVFVDRLCQREVAQRFDYSYDAFRQLVAQFRAALDAGEPPPFSTSNGAADPPPRRQRRRCRAPSNRPLPTRAP